MTDAFDRLKSALADRYSIEREIGSGGMATVYVAEDLKLRRKVALKVLKPDLAAALGPDRFLQEIDIAAKLTHPHILGLHDCGEADGFLYYVMPYIEGESLREKLAREGELPISDSVRILKEVVDALAEAHSSGVVHRDIKPDNVMLSGRHALVTDFGVAKAVSESTGRNRLTTEGIALGTPAYMAPEQAAADPHIDHRADIYAIGAVAYELLTGRPPFTGTTQQEILAAHVTQAADPVTKYRESVPPALAALVMRCLEKKPADRWQTAEELLPQLEALATPSGVVTPTGARPVLARKRNPKLLWAFVAAVVLVAAVSLLAGLSRTAVDTSAAALPDSTWRVILVANLDHSPADSTLAMGSSEALRGQLQGTPKLIVPARADLADWCRRIIGPQGCPVNADSLYELSMSRGWHGVLTGSVQRLGPGYVFSVSLRSTGGARVQVGASETAADSADIVAAVGRLAENLSEQLVEVMPGLERAPGEERTFFHSVRSLEAYRVYSDAERLWGTDDIAAMDGYRQAIRLDSTFAGARRRLAVGLGNLGIRRAEQVQESEAANLLRDQLRPWERSLFTAWYFSSRGEDGLALEEYRRLLDDFPSFAWPLVNSAIIYWNHRDFALAERLYRSTADTTLRYFGQLEWGWVGTLIDMDRSNTVDSLFLMATENAADTGTWFNYSKSERLIAERRYFEFREIDQHALLGRPPTRTDYFEKLGWDQYTALVLGHMTEYDSVAAEYAGIHGEWTTVAES